MAQLESSASARMTLLSPRNGAASKTAKAEESKLQQDESRGRSTGVRPEVVVLAVLAVLGVTLGAVSWSRARSEAAIPTGGAATREQQHQHDPSSGSGGEQGTGRMPLGQAAGEVLLRSLKALGCRQKSVPASVSLPAPHYLSA